MVGARDVPDCVDLDKAKLLDKGNQIKRSCWRFSQSKRVQPESAGVAVADL